MKSISFSGRSVPAFLLVVSILSFGLLLPELGFYWDDWAKILVARLWGLPAYFQYYAGDRPLSSWTHILFTPLLGYAPLGWHILTLALRWLSAWGMNWGLNQIWPWARRQNLVAALIFLVYPVFVSQPAAVTFHQQWLQYALFFLSIGLMLLAQRARTRGPAAYWTLTGFSLLAMLGQLSVTEYFSPLELVRPVMLWLLLGSLVPSSNISFTRMRIIRVKLVKIFSAWAPYLLVTAAYVLWRLFFLKLPGADPYRAKTLYAFLRDPLGTLQAVTWVAFVDEMRILVNSWGELFNIQVTGLTPFMILAYLIGVGAAALTVFYLVRFREQASGGEESGNAGLESSARADPSDRTWRRQALALGLAAVLLGPVPAWITGRQVVFDFHSDRYAMAAMFGASLLVTVLIEWLAQKRVQRAVLAGVLVALAVALHLRVANNYRWIWTAEQRLFWQLSWRAPGLKAPTALIFENEPFPNQGLFSTSAAFNLMYPQPMPQELVAAEGQDAPVEQAVASENLAAAEDQPAANPSAMPAKLAYWVYTLRPRYTRVPDSLKIGFSTTFRTLSFSGDTPNSLLLYSDPRFSNCVWVLSERDANHPYLPDLVRSFLPISNLDRIEPLAAQPGYPPAEMIGPEPARTSWCYFFEKADLARQQRDWPTIVQLASGAKAQGYSPLSSGSNSPYEWLPFIEGYQRTGDWQTAAELTQQAYQRDSHYRPMLCDQWNGEAVWSSSNSQAMDTAKEVKAGLECGK